MKKLLFLLIFWPVLVSGEKTQIWTDSVKIPIVDTVRQNRNLGDISTYNCTCEFDLSNLNGTIIVDFGGGYKILNATSKLYAFNAFQNDSLPYTLSNTAYRDTINGIAQNVKSFTFKSPWGYDYPAMRITRGTATAGLKLKWICKFYK